MGGVCWGAVWLLGRAFSVRTPLWFSDTALVLVIFASFLLSLALVWDGLLCGLGAVRAVRRRLRGEPPAGRWWREWRAHGFLSLGWWPLAFVLLTIHLLLGTSTVSQISLQLLASGTTQWLDAFYWGLEGPFLRWLLASGVNVTLWETVYNSGWQAEMTVLFVVLVVTRSAAAAAGFCVSFVLLFYLGRLVGLLSPVMGPAFFVPEHFAYLEGSLTEQMMARVEERMLAGPTELEEGAVWLGGVAAMPSLHVGMVSLAAWWLVRAVRWLAPLAALWVLAVWTSTVLLGWHYAVDGLGGLVVAVGCIALTDRILGPLGLAWSARPRGGEPVPPAAVGRPPTN